MSASFTPGPWLVHADGVWVEAMCDHLPIAVATNYVEARGTDRRANACLIAAAPELYEKLCEMRDAISYIDERWAFDLTRECDVILNKARGEA